MRNPSGSAIIGPIDNLGTIEQNVAGELDISGVINDGSIQVSNGGVVLFNSQGSYDINGFPADIAWKNNADGTITATQGATLLLYDNWTNQGTINVDSSSTVSLGNSYLSDSPNPSYIWTNSGTLAIAKGATVYLGDDFSTDEFEDHFHQLGANLDLSDYTVYLIGTIENSPADNPITRGSLVLNASTGPLICNGEINQGTITTNGPDDLVAFYGELSGVTLDGTLDMSGSDANIFIINGLTLDTDLNVSGADATVVFFDSTGSTLAVGPLVQSATVHLSGAGATMFIDGIQTVIVNQGITLSGENPSSTITGPIDNLGTVAQNGAGQMTLTEVVNGGSVTVASGGTVTSQGPFGNAGAVIIAAGGTFSTTGANYDQWAGTTTVDGLLIAANVNLGGGVLTGAGTIQADVTNAATVEPGDPFGTLTIQGNYTQTAAGLLLIRIAGPDQYGRLAITGIATLAGTLEVSLLDNYVPAVGASFQILTFAEYTGIFTREIGLAPPRARSLKPVWDNHDLTLTETG